MVRFRIAAAMFAAFMLLISAVFAEESGVAVDEISLEDLALSEQVSDTAGREIFTPSYGSSYTDDLGSSYWTTPMDITDEKAVWNMLMEPITVVDKGKGSSVKSQTYLYLEPDASSKPVAEVTCESQGVRVLRNLDNGWSLVECYSSSFATPRSKTKAWNLLVSGYLPTKYLKQVTPNPDLALVVDKLTQLVYIFQDGKLLDTLVCSTGKVMHNGKYWQPWNETRSGEFLMTSKIGNIQSDSLICSYTIRFNYGDEIHEVPHVVGKDGKTKFYKSTEPKLGTKASHGCIRVQRQPTPQGINMKWIWNQVKNNSMTKIVIWEDWQGRQLSYPSDDTVLYYNPNKGQYYHTQETCNSAKKGITFVPFLYSQLDDEGFSGLQPCDYCTPPRRKAEIDAVNEVYAPGGDHDPQMTKLRQDYYDYLANE